MKDIHELGKKFTKNGQKKIIKRLFDDTTQGLTVQSTAAKDFYVTVVYVWMNLTIEFHYVSFV